MGKCSFLILSKNASYYTAFFQTIFYLFLLVGCVSDRPLYTSNLNLAGKPINEPQEEVLSSLCELYKDPHLYNKKVIKVKTTLTRIAPFTTLQDERCLMRHPVIEVEFTSEFESFVCNSKNEYEEKLCLIVRMTKQNKTAETEFEVIADIVGYTESYRCENGFTLNGLCFRFIIQEIRNIEKIIPVKVEKMG
jgi:hypothetical protein